MSLTFLVFILLSGFFVALLWKYALLRRIATGLFLLGAAALTVTLWGRHYAWSQRLTVTVATPAGEVSGSAVSHMRERIGWIPLSGNDQEDDLSGEATVVTLAPGKYLFALLGEDAKWLALRAFRDTLPDRDKDDIYGALARKREMIVLPPKLYPLLVTFDDLKVPASVKQVDPDNLAAAFGEGYALTSIALEIVDEPVTRGEVEKVLPWLRGHRGRVKPIGDPIPKDHISRPEDDIYRGSFSTEVR